MSREIKFEIMLLKHNRDFSKSIIKHYTTLDRLMNGRDKSLYANLQVIAKRQFTGLKNSKGVEVYNGDIVKLEGGQIVAVDLTPKKAIEYGHGDCAFSIHLPIIYGYGVGGDFEVIGNVYENSELLEQAK